MEKNALENSQIGVKNIVKNRENRQYESFENQENFIDFFTDDINYTEEDFEEIEILKEFDF